MNWRREQPSRPLGKSITLWNKLEPERRDKAVVDGLGLQMGPIWGASFGAAVETGAGLALGQSCKQLAALLSAASLPAPVGGTKTCLSTRLLVMWRPHSTVLWARLRNESIRQWRAAWLVELAAGSATAASSNRALLKSQVRLAVFRSAPGAQACWRPF